MHDEFLSMVKGHGEGDITLTKHDGYASIVIDNRRKRNSITGRMMFKFACIVDELTGEQRDAQDKLLVAVVLTGAGSEAFCSGADLGLAREVLDTPAKGGLMSAFMTDALNRLRQSGLISLCSLNGPALGGGSEITTACDFRIMPRDNTTYIQFIHAKIGACPGWGGARRLTHIVGRNNAILACAGSLKLFADGAQSMRLIDATYPPFDPTHSTTESDASSPEDHAIAEGLKFLQPFTVQKFPGSVRAIKQAIAGVEHLDAESSKDLEAHMFKQRWAGSDNKAALNAPKK